MERLAVVKLALRRSTDAIDAEIQQYIDQCLIDLQQTGIDVETETTLITGAIIAYCKAQLNFGDKGEQWNEVYNKDKTLLASRGVYTGVANG